ncbi:MAG: DUF5317 domain-containing protein [Actinobacteria bacterium]|nr:DUF5317 domain-containing protein [Actinomycetota bacterium]
MPLILLTLALSFGIGLLAGGSLSHFPSVKVRWTWVALAGVVLQFLVIRGSFAFPVLLASFALLLVFAGANVRAPGFALILLGLALNLVAIAANHGMPVTRHALVASGQASTLGELRTGAAGQKHRLAGDGTKLLPLGDVIPIGPPIGQAVSIGDLLMHAGIGWFVVVGVRRTKPAEAGEIPGDPSSGR